ncbi:SAF domain-containing protein [Rhodococcus aerolatus]
MGTSSRRAPGPTAWERGVAALRPGWARGVALRRAAAALLVLLAAVLVVRGDPAADRRTVLVATRDLAPGQVVTEGDVALVARADDAVPAGALVDAAGATGRPVAGAVRAGETLTDVRLLGPALLSTVPGGAGAVAVPVRLADTGVADLLRPGDRVAVVRAAGASGEGPAPELVLARDATVLLAADGPAAPGARTGRLVVLALPAEPASAVASASLAEPLTVTLG